MSSRSIGRAVAPGPADEAADMAPGYLRDREGAVHGGRCRRRTGAASVVLAVLLSGPAAAAPEPGSTPLQAGSAAVSPEEDPPGQRGSWCGVGENVRNNFRLRNGKTVSICEENDTLTYAFGDLGSHEPELVHSGPILATIRVTASLWGTAEMSLCVLAESSELEDHGIVGTDDQAIAISQLAEARDINGFVRVQATTGLVSETTHVFRRGGWEYAISETWGRPMNVPEEELDDYRTSFVRVLSPSEQGCLSR